MGSGSAKPALSSAAFAALDREAAAFQEIGATLVHPAEKA